MKYDEAMNAAKSGAWVTLPHWYWCWVRYDKGRGVHILEHEDGRRQKYQATPSEYNSTEWMENR